MPPFVSTAFILLCQPHKKIILKIFRSTALLRVYIGSRRSTWKGKTDFLRGGGFRFFVFRSQLLKLFSFVYLSYVLCYLFQYLAITGLYFVASSY